MFDKRLQRIEHKLDRLSEGICEVQEGNEMSIEVNEENSALPKSGLLSIIELLSVGGMYILLSAVESVLSKKRQRNEVICMLFFTIY